MITFFFNSPKKMGTTTSEDWRPPVEFMPVSTIIMPRKAYKVIATRFLGHMARQEEPLPKKEE